MATNLNQWLGDPDPYSYFTTTNVEDTGVGTTPYNYGYSDLIGDSGLLNLFGMTPESYLTARTESDTIPYNYGYSDFGDSGYLNLFGMSPETPVTGGAGTSGGSDLFNLGGNYGPTTRTVEGKGIFTDLNADMVANPGEKYDPSSSIWNGWMSQQNSMQQQTTPTSEGLGYVPTNQDEQDYQNALTMSNYTNTPLTTEQTEQFSLSTNPWFGDAY